MFIKFILNKPYKHIIRGVYNPENQNCDETETEKNINWMKTAMLSNGCSHVSLVDAKSEILLISKR